MLCLALLLVTSRILAVNSSVVCPSQAAGAFLQSGVATVGSTSESPGGGRILPGSNNFPSTFVKGFHREPSVAISIYQLIYNNNQFSSLLLSVSPSTISKTSFSLDVVVDEKMARWTKLTIRFLAEAHFNLFAGSYKSNLLPVNGQPELFSIAVPLTEKWDKYQTLTIRGFLNGFNFSGIPTQLQSLTYLRCTVSQEAALFFFKADATALNRAISFSYVAYSNKTSADISDLIFTKSSGSYRSPVVSKIRKTDKFFAGLTGFQLSAKQESLLFHFDIVQQEVVEFACNFSSFCLTFLVIKETTCTNCPQPSYLFRNTCVPSCARNQFITYKGQCFTCPTNMRPADDHCQCLEGTQLSMGFCVRCNEGYSLKNGIHCSPATFIVQEPTKECDSMIGSYFNGKDCICRQTQKKWDPTCSNTVTNRISLNFQITNLAGPYPPYSIACPDGYVHPAINGFCVKCNFGCASCKTDNTCSECMEGFELSSQKSFCQQICGDGKRFILQCDDGNLSGGDGCDSNCQMEGEFSCQGGSPVSRDVCWNRKPTTLTLNVSSTYYNFEKGIREYRFRINWLPPELLQNNCSQCTSIFDLKFSRPLSDFKYIFQFIPSTRYDFRIRTQESEPANRGNFSVRVQVKSSFQTPHFSGINISRASVELS